MSSRARVYVRPLSSFGWSLTGALLVALSLPPVGFFPLAWVGLVPLLVRWSVRRPSIAYGRELYALLLTTSCCVGFWLLFNPDASTAALGGISLFVVPIPLTLSFILSGFVREKYGLRLGLAAFVGNVLALEFLLLRSPVALPWLLMGHTQVEAIDFIQIVDIGGVLLLSAWVLALNVLAFLALPRTKQPAARFGERGISIAFFTVLVVMPVAYGAIRTAQTDVPAAYARIGIVQPGVPPSTWDTQTATTKVNYLAQLSDDLIARWATVSADSSRAARAPTAADPGLLLWPQSSLPYTGADRRERALYDRLGHWAARRNVSILAGARTVADPQAAHPFGIDDEDLTNSAVLIRPDRTVERYDQMRRVPFADAASAAGSQRTVLGSGRAQIATAVGFESVFGDHVRRFTKDGANLIVVLSRNDLWGRSAGMHQHLQFTRLRAIEARRSVVLSTVSGVSALIQPSGDIVEVAGWMEQDLIPIDVPTYRGETFYVRHGDWLGQAAVLFVLGFHLLLYVLSKFVPEVFLKRDRPRKPAFG